MSAQDPNASTESKGGALVATAAAFMTLSWLSVLLRTYVRAIMLKGFQADDWLMLVAQVCHLHTRLERTCTQSLQVNYTTSCSLILIGVTYGLGRHNKSLSQENEIESLKYQALATATYISNMMFIKFSIGLFLLRLATQRRYRYTIYGSIFVVGIWSLVLFFWNMFQCNPVAAQWDYTILQNDKTATCVTAEEVVSAAYSLSAMTVLTDWFYALIPVPLVWSVKMTQQAKATVMVVLGLGVFASVATLIRLKFLADLTDLEDLLCKCRNPRCSCASTNLLSDAPTDAMVWTLIEPGVAIVASSLVTIRPLLRAWRIRGFQSTENSKRTGPSSTAHPSSRMARSNTMPGFGSRDLASMDVEAGQVKMDRLSTTVVEQGNRSKNTHMSPVGERTSQDSDLTNGPIKHIAGAYRPPEVSHETYRVGGPPTPHPPGRPVYRDVWRSSHSATSSEVELTRMEPTHKQSHGRAGLGPYR